VAIIYTGRPSQQYYPNNQVFDLRDQLSALFYGDASNPGIAQKVLVRRLSDKYCVCWNGKTGSPDSACRYCQGEGWLWVETLNSCYMAFNFGGVLNPSNVISRSSVVGPAGVTDENRALAYFEASAFPNYERYTIPTNAGIDKLYELKVDPNGRMLQPVVRTSKWKIASFTVHKGDDGEVIFCELGLEKEFL
jgi:hypothetical protein